jgi:hypothetical protein
MACPYFYPVERFDEKAWPKHPRLPLGDPYVGLCRADPMRERRPDDAVLRDYCNLGYARGRCPQFPGSGPDALRFSVVGDRHRLLRIFYVLEKEHATVEHGTLEYSEETREFLVGHSNRIIEQQAGAYAASYVHRKLNPEQARNPHRR